MVRARAGIRLGIDIGLWLEAAGTRSFVIYGLFAGT